MSSKQRETDDVISEPALHDGDGTITRRRFFRSDATLPVRIEVWELEPGASEGMHIHDGEDALEEFYYFISGRGIMLMDDKEIDVGPGDAILAPPGVDHGIRCIGEETLKLVIAWGMPAN